MEEWTKLSNSKVYAQNCYKSCLLNRKAIWVYRKPQNLLHNFSYTNAKEITYSVITHRACNT